MAKIIGKATPESMKQLEKWRLEKQRKALRRMFHDARNKERQVQRAMAESGVPRHVRVLFNPIKIKG